MKEIAKKKFRTAAWLSIINAVLTMPAYSLCATSYFINHPGINGICTALMVTTFILLIVIFSTFRRVLNAIYNFRGVDEYISAFLACNAQITGWGISFVWAGPNIVRGAILGFCVIFGGIVLLVFAIKMLSFKENIVGLLRPFAYAILAQAICILTVVLIPLALFASVAVDVILALLFFRISEQLPTAA